MNIFISCPISKYFNSDNQIDKDYVSFLEKVYQICSEKSSSVYLALKNEDYNIKDMDSDEVCTLKDYNALLNSDLIIAIPEDSQGVAVELGWASALNKRIIIAYEDKYLYSALIKALSVVTDVTLLHMKKIDNYSTVDESFFDNLRKNMIRG